MTLAHLEVLDHYAAKPFPFTYPLSHRTFNAPVDNVAGAISACVAATTAKQVLAMYSYTHPALISFFAAKVVAGVPSLLVLDSSELSAHEWAALQPILSLFGSKYPEFRLSVGTAEDGHDIMHRKVYVGDDLLCVTGSFNWTESATKEDNQTTVGLWTSDAALLTASIEATYAWQMAHHPQPDFASPTPPPLPSYGMDLEGSSDVD